MAGFNFPNMYHVDSGKGYDPVGLLALTLQLFNETWLQRGNTGWHRTVQYGGSPPCSRRCPHKA